MICSRSLAAASLLAALSAFTVTQSVFAAPSGSVLLKYKYKPGQVLHYQMTESTIGSTMGMAMNSHMTMMLTETVKSVDPATGNATILVQSNTPTSTMTMNGKPLASGMPHIPPMTITEVVSPLGKPVSANMGGAGAPSSGDGVMSMIMPNSGGGNGLGQLGAFPNHPVSVGDIWRSASGMGGLGAGQVNVKQSLVGLRSSGGHSMADIATRYSMNIAPKAGAMMQMSTLSTGTSHQQFDVTSGTLTSTTTKMVMTMKSKAPAGAASQNGMGMSMGAFETHMTMTMNMRLVGG